MTNSTCRQQRLVKLRRLAAVAALLTCCDPSLAADKLTIGAIEDVLLLPWKVTLPARIDTGASRSSLGANDLQIQGNLAVFKLRAAFGNQELRLPIVTWRGYKTSEGHDRRPIVELELCLGPRRFRTRVNLNRRSHLKYPFLVGRIILKDNFVVDVSRSRLLPPTCENGPQPQ